MSTITCATWRKDIPEDNYCAMSIKCLMLMILILYRLESPASATSSEELKVATKVLIIWSQLTPPMSLGWNVISPIITSTIPLSIRGYRGTVWGPTYAWIVACPCEPDPMSKMTSMHQRPSHSTCPTWQYSSTYCAVFSSPSKTVPRSIWHAPCNWYFISLFPALFQTACRTGTPP